MGCWARRGKQRRSSPLRTDGGWIMTDDAPSKCPLQLVGRVYHRIISNNNTTTDANKKKRRRDESNSKTSNFEMGFIFVPQVSTSDDVEQLTGDDTNSSMLASIFSSKHNDKNFSIVVPYLSLRMACYAASMEKLIQISQYSLIRYGEDGFGELIFTTSQPNDHNRNDAITLDSGIRLVIEVHHDGLHVVPSENDRECIDRRLNINNGIGAMTIETLAHGETQNNHQCDSKSTKKSPGRDLMNVTGIVDAISPILVNDSQTEPFAILELYQPPSNEDGVTDVKSAVAVIRGEQAMCMHPTIHPGQSITLIGVISRKWKVPDEFQKHLTSREVSTSDDGDLYLRLEHRVPDRVILISQATQICWNDEEDLNTLLPSTVESLTSIRGIVKSVHYHVSHSKDDKEASYVAHFVYLKPLIDGATPNDARKLVRIFLPKYSMSPNLMLGLQPGAALRAVNIHSIHTSDNVNNTLCTNYVACLRSTLAIERCAGYCSHRTRISSSWFVPRDKAFLLIPDHRITEMCCDPFNTKSTTQIFAEHKLRRKLEIKLGDSGSSETPDTEEYAQRPIAISCHTSKPSKDAKHTFLRERIDALLAHHYRYVHVQLIGKMSHHKNFTKRVSNRVSRRLTIRDPYAEFFDHAHSKSNNDTAECGSSCNHLSCFNNYHHFESTSVPFLVGLEDVRDSCSYNFMKRVAVFCQSRLRDASSSVSSGWTSSYNYQGLALLQIMNDYARAQTKNGRSKVWHDISNDSMHNVYVLGFADNNDKTVSFRDESCNIPICKERRLDGPHGIHHEYNDLPIWMQLGSVIVSCLCLGSRRNENETYSITSNHFESQEIPHSFLPSRTDAKTEYTDGHGFVFLVDNLVFIASVHITARSFVSMDRHTILRENANATKALQKKPCEKAAYCGSLKNTVAITIQECLSAGLLNSSSYIFGRLVRQRWTFRKLKLVQIGGQLTKCYTGWTVVLSHVDPFADIEEGSSALQTIDVGMSIEFDEFHQNRSDTLDHALQELVYKDKEVTMRTNNSGKFLSVDQLTMAVAWWIVSENCRTTPLQSGGLMMNPSSVQLEIPATSCTYSNLGYQRFRCNLGDDIDAFFVSDPRTANIPRSGELEFCNTGQFLPGILSRRLGRVPPYIHNILGTAELVFCHWNPPGLLTRLKCQRGVPSATLSDLHWDICTSLKKGDHSHIKPSLLRRIHNAKILGISFCRARMEHGSVKWECSALIDDGTGQAKLYAERESALLLLGDNLNVQTIENGARELEEGIFFQPALPASTHLMQCISDASMRARRSHVKRDTRGGIKQGRASNEEMPSIYSLLPAAAKAEYLLQQHCRHWYQNHRQNKLDLFCRCKPLSEDVTSVNHTDIQVAKAFITNVEVDFVAATTASLPPLKLILEDACIAAEESYDDNISGWGTFIYSPT